MSATILPIPDFFKANHVGQIRRINYQDLAVRAEAWKKQDHIEPAYTDSVTVALLLIDVQNTFCIPDFELFVGGTSGTAAVDDNVRLCRFIYRNLAGITTICPTMDTHQASQIFHSIFLVNDKGEHPAPYTIVSLDNIEKGVWRFNSELGQSIQIDAKYGQDHLEFYAQRLKESGKYDLTIWPYHAMLGGIGHALVPAVEEAVFFHCQVRASQPDFQLKGFYPLTENYSVLNPEVLKDNAENTIAAKNTEFIEKLLTYDAVIIAGQAKSHCVAWTIEDLLKDSAERDPVFAGKVYLLEDCTSPVVIPDVIDYTEQADHAFQRFAAQGAHIVQSTEPLENWPDFPKS